MPAITIPGTSIKYGWQEREKGWGPGMNTNLLVLGVIAKGQVLSQTTTAPPSDPDEGDAYIIPAGATGAWSGRENEIAAFFSDAWVYIEPVGTPMYVIDEAARAYYDGSEWGTSELPQYDFVNQSTAAGDFASLADDDILLGVDVSDTTGGAEGTTKKLEIARVFEMTSAAAPLHAWTPPDQPSALVSEAEAFADAENWNANQFISNLWEPLRAAHPDYISGGVLGSDQSGTYDVYRYIFEPPHYDRTMILSCSMHGNEVTNQLALYRILHHMIHDWHKYPQLAHLRWRVRLVVLPIVNPWGISQATRSRTNSRNVDINRNFDYRWEEYTQSAPYDGKGDAPFSEAETRYVRDTLAEFSGADVYLDLHDYPAGTETDYPIYVPAEFSDGTAIVAEVVSWLKNGEESSNVGTIYNPSGFTFAAAEHGMYTANPEFSSAKYGAVFSSGSITKAVRWYGNVLAAYARAPAKADASNGVAGRAWLALFQAAGAAAQITTTSSEYEEAESLRLDIDIPQSGYLKVSGVAVVSASVASQVLISPIIGQDTYGAFGADDAISWPSIGVDKYMSLEAYASISSSSDRVAIPFNAVVPVKHTSTVSGQAGKARVGMVWRTTAGTATLQRYRVTAEFVPSALGDERVQVFDATSTGVMTRSYPAN